MQRFKHVFLLWSCIAALTVLATQSTGVEAAAPKHGPLKIPPTPAASTTATSTLFGITALSSNSIWAVGTSMNVPQFTGQPLIEHWDGNKWQVVPGPSAPQNEFNSLIGVSAVTNNDIWAVGFSMNTTKLTDQPLIEHWDGNNWLIVPYPTTIKAGGLSAITALGADDIWAVGSTYSASGTSSKPLILHWDGNNWQVIPGASTTGNSSLLSVTAVNANDIWAVGTSSSTKESKPLIEHWNGNNWQSISGPISGMHFNELSGITALSDHDIWTVGSSFSQPLQVHPSIEHWDGNKWSTLSPSGLPSSFAPTAISALSDNDIWIAGAQTLAHWSGQSWQSLPSTSQKGFNLINAITALTHDNIWAAGFSVETRGALPLIEHWNGSKWQIVSSPSPAFKSR
ncbi:MAG: hypothetical protein JO215_13080 [Ktedonobacteraceae bacterium]|nr:hypothetical protein [Ktedonobacteraceae bacterium]